jgi:hypothetical protein
MGVYAQPPAIIMAAEEPDWVFANAGMSVEFNGYNYFTAWLEVPGIGGEPDQRIFRCRLVMPMPAARACNTQASKAWTRGGH